MCTALSLSAGGFYFGRNLDLDVPFGDTVAITPRRFPLAFRLQEALSTHHAMIGMATVAGSYPLYAEAANEKGLCMAGLHFPHSAHYPDIPVRGKHNVASFELIPHVLGRCANLSEAKALLEKTNVVSLSFSQDFPATPLHWLIADKSGSVALEITTDGTFLYDNPVGVLTNEPPLPFHLVHLYPYQNLSPNAGTAAFLGKAPFSLGLGAYGLPGDYSSLSRFVKAAWLRAVITESLSHEATTEAGDGLLALFSILSAVAPPKGAVLTAEKRPHYTHYACGIDTEKGLYVYTTQRNPTPRTVPLFSVNLDSDHLLLSNV